MMWLVVSVMVELQRYILSIAVVTAAFEAVRNLTIVTGSRDKHAWKASVLVRSNTIVGSHVPRGREWLAANL